MARGWVTAAALLVAGCNGGAEFEMLSPADQEAGPVARSQQPAAVTEPMDAGTTMAEASLVAVPEAAAVADAEAPVFDAGATTTDAMMAEAGADAVADAGPSNLMRFDRDTLANPNLASGFLTDRDPGSVSLPEGAVTVQWWFTLKGCSPLDFGLDVSVCRLAAITPLATLGRPATRHADAVLTVYDCPAISAGGSFGVHVSIASLRGTTFGCSLNTPADYSSDALADAGSGSTVTVYVNGQLVWGVEPTPETDP